MILSRLALFASLAVQCVLSAPNFAGKPNRMIKPYLNPRAPLQDIVKWDEHTLYVNGERVLLYSGEVHPFRLPVPALWLDLLQKIKAMGYNCVSFYVDWALLEPKPGSFSAEGVLAWEPFFEAAQKAGVYLIARPGPYINAEVSGGGFPGWLMREVAGVLRTSDKDYMDATRHYMQKIGEIVAKAQITNGGPIILFQPENEYSLGNGTVKFPDAPYMQDIIDSFRKAGIVVPMISNDAWPQGINAPGTGEGEVDIYGHDNYPLGFDCANPRTWPDGKLPTWFWSDHMRHSPKTPYSVLEFQGGAFDPWGGLGFEQCSELLNHEFERVFHKNMFAHAVTIFNVYMTYGGTNWGNLGHAGGYTSYDYGAVLRENRGVDREKYSESKLEATFLQSSPAYLTAVPQQAGTNWTTTTDLTVTPVYETEGDAQTRFWVLRHTAYNSEASTTYKLKLATSAGTLTIPQVGTKSLTLNGRDTKIHVSDYKVAEYNMLYSTAEVFTWRKNSPFTTLILYGGPGEFHEVAFSNLKSFKPHVIEGDRASVSFDTTTKKGQTIFGFTVSTERRAVKLQDDLIVYLVGRNEAYNYWLSTEEGAFSSTDALIVKAGYLVRSAKSDGKAVYLTGDINATTPIEVFNPPSTATKLFWNGAEVKTTKKAARGTLVGTVRYSKPKTSIPKLSQLPWKVIDALPELKDGYDDSKWRIADRTDTNNTRKLTTPTSLYGSDYGFHSGSLLFRGHFTADGTEKTLKLQTQGGNAFGMSAWLNGEFLSSWTGIDKDSENNATITLPNIPKGKKSVLTVLIDHMGINGNWVIGTETGKHPRGILDYDLVGRPKSTITWRLTGNLGGEDFINTERGPLNEGGLYPERQGLHLPGAPTSSWSASKPTDGIKKPGVAFYTTQFKLDLPSAYDTPLSFHFSNTTSLGTDTPYRSQLWVNGWQFGKYVSNVGPQRVYPVPPGILNYQGVNTLAVSLWALDKSGGKVEGLELVAGHPVQWGYGEVKLVEADGYKKREGAY